MKTFIEWNDILSKKANGREKVKCPNCITTRSNKSDRSLSVNHNLGLAKCHYCEAISIRDKKQRNEKSYTAPPQTWQNYTGLSDKLVKWVAKERKIRQETLIEFGITEEKAYQPQHQKEVNNLVFNYFEGENLVNKKYRSGDKQFTQTKGGKPILYNINSVIGHEEVWIVEGEFDVLALSEVGIKSVVSLPSGANDNDEYWINSEPYMKDVKRFIIGVDCDDKGIIIREKIAQRLGRYRCDFIEWHGKDANDDLIRGQLAETVKHRQRFPVGGTFSVDDLMDSIIELYDQGLPKTLRLKNKAFGNLNDVWTTMRGHLITSTGIPSHGKSSFVEWYGLNLVNEYDMKMSFFSPEHSPMALHQSRIIEKVTGKKFFGTNRLSKSNIERYQEWAREKVYLTGAENGEFPTWSWLFEKFKEQMFAFGIDIFVVDAFNKVEFDKGGNDFENIRKVLTRLTSFAQQNNVLIFLVAHPTKMRKKEDGTYEMPTLYDVSGSADFRNQTHDGFTIHRHFGNEEALPHTIFMNTKTKFSFQGEMGQSVMFNYDIDNGRYYSTVSHPDKSDWTDKFQEQTGVIPNLEFDEFADVPDDLPF
jgi:twinkle protein